VGAPDYLVSDSARRRLPAAAALLAASLALVLAGCGGGAGESAGTTAQPTSPSGDAAAGKSIFAEQGCGSCHTFGAAGSTGIIGPNLDEALGRDADRAGKPLAEFVRESIVQPDAFVAPDFKRGVMPKTFGESLSNEQLADLVAFLTEG
jgi:mono/diheme cytochrome c family protein